MEMLDILTRESENTQQVYVYEEEGHWYAYERSAQLVKKILNGIVRICLSRGLGDVYKRQVEVDLATLIEKCPIVLCSDSEIVIECPEI